VQQCAARRVATVRRYVAPHAGPSLDAASAEPHGTPVRPVAPLLAALLDEPSPVALLGGP
jgi:hypothetical protein